MKKWANEKAAVGTIIAFLDNIDSSETHSMELQLLRERVTVFFEIGFSFVNVTRSQKSSFS